MRSQQREQTVSFALIGAEGAVLCLLLNLVSKPLLYNEGCKNIVAQPFSGVNIVKYFFGVWFKII
jgi:hypothetical protein